jgi:hypothetical protein
MISNQFFQTLAFSSIVVMTCSMLSSCSEEKVYSPPFEPAGDMAHTMAFVLDPAADLIWDSAGTIVTASGEEDLAPTTDEQWLAVRSSAVVVAETGNLLMMPGRAVDQDAWVEISVGLIKVGKRLEVAAQNQDADALFEEGANLYNVCVACHQIYVTEDADED